MLTTVSASISSHFYNVLTWIILPTRYLQINDTLTIMVWQQDSWVYFIPLTIILSLGWLSFENHIHIFLFPKHHNGHWMKSRYGRHQELIALCTPPKLIIMTYCNHIKKGLRFNSSPPGVAYMRQWTLSTLVQVMARHLFGAKPLPEPMLPYCQLDPWEQTSVKFESRYNTFHSWKCTWKCRLRKGGHFCPALR